jgi:hypothetical protein
MTPAQVQRWLDAYVHAWETSEPAEIGDLFTETAEYRWHPWDKGEDVVHGRHRIVAEWLRNPDAPGTFAARYRPLVVTDDMAIAEGTSLYYSDQTRQVIDRTYYNLWVLRFAEDGRCRSFTEWFMLAPAPTGV